MILLNPGPVTLSQRVRAALAQPDLCHREPEFGDLQQRLRTGLLGVYALDPACWSSVLLTGSGTAAVEAMLSSLVPPDVRLITLENGVYGERLTRIARAHRIDVTPVHVAWEQMPDLTALDDVLAGLEGPVAVAAVHHETTTGRLNDMAAVGAVCRQHGVNLLVDAVSSFGGEAIGFEDWPVAAVAATGNKCLHGVPGAAFVIARRQVLDLTPSPGRSLYLDLAGHARAQDAGGTAFTPGIPAFYALEEALAELAEQGGWPARHRRYRALAEQLRAALAAQGVMPYIPTDDASVVLRSYHLPPGLDYATLHDELKAAGFVIYAGQGGLAEILFRVSTMGAIEDGDMQRLIAAFERILADRTGSGQQSQEGT